MTQNAGYKIINSPFKWVGGKSRLRKQIVALIPDHTCYVELFAGAAWVLFAKPPSKVEVLNDIDRELVNFFRVVKYKPEELIRSFAWELVSRAEFERLANLDTSTLTDIERAHRFYYLIMAGWGGELHYPRFQTSITDGGHGNRLIGALKFLRNRIEPVYDRLQKVVIENMDWQKCFDRYDRAQTAMYLDPPIRAMAVITATICEIGMTIGNWPPDCTVQNASGFCRLMTRPKSIASTPGTTFSRCNVTRG